MIVVPRFPLLVAAAVAVGRRRRGRDPRHLAAAARRPAVPGRGTADRVSASGHAVGAGGSPAPLDVVDPARPARRRARRGDAGARRRRPARRRVGRPLRRLHRSGRRRDLPQRIVDSAARDRQRPTHRPHRTHVDRGGRALADRHQRARLRPRRGRRGVAGRTRPTGAPRRSIPGSGQHRRGHAQRAGCRHLRDEGRVPSAGPRPRVGRVVRTRRAGRGRDRRHCPPAVRPHRRSVHRGVDDRRTRLRRRDAARGIDPRHHRLAPPRRSGAGRRRRVGPVAARRRR